MESKIELRGFYPKYMEITEVEKTDGELHVEMESVTAKARCPPCMWNRKQQATFRLYEKKDTRPAYSRKRCQSAGKSADVFLYKYSM
jgi:hypothetical protein